MINNKKTSKINRSLLLLIAVMVSLFTASVLMPKKTLAAPNCYEKYGTNAVLAYECTTNDAFITDLGTLTPDESKCYVKDLTGGSSTAKEVDCNSMRFADAVLPKCFLNKRLTDCGAAINAAKAAGKNLEVGKCYDITDVLGGIKNVDCNSVAPAKSIINGSTICPSGVDSCEGTTGSVAPRCSSQVTNADADCDVKQECTKGDLSEKNCGITRYLKLFINLLSGLVGVVVVVVLVLGGIQYTTSAGDPNAAAAAKKRISNAILALIAFALMYGFLQWLVPGGVL